MNYREIDMDNYPRKEHFNHFLSMENPFISLTFRCNITDWVIAQKESGYPFFLSFQYAVVKAANKIPELRQRILNGKVVEYDFSNPSYTLMLPDHTFRFCPVDATISFDEYINEAIKMQDKVSKEILSESDTLGLLFISCSPWFDYESLNLAYPNRLASNPNITWGKCCEETKLVLENDRVIEKMEYTMPITIMVNHALVDAIHIKDFISNLNDELNNMIKNVFNNKNKGLTKEIKYGE